MMGMKLSGRYMKYLMIAVGVKRANGLLAILPKRPITSAAEPRGLRIRP